MIPNEARVERACRHDQLPAEHRLGELADGDMQCERGNWCDRRSAQRSPYRLHDSRVLRVIRCDARDRPAKIVAVHRKAEQFREIVDMDPWHPLPAASERAAGAEIEDR